jgi:DNA anti-recombination protein RmuC
MTVEGLKQDLQTLSESVPLVTARASDALHGAEELEKAAQALLADVEAAHSEASTQLTRVHDALPAMAAQVEGDAKRIGEASVALNAAWADADPVLERAASAVADRLDEVQSHLHDLRTALAEAGTKIDQAQTVGDEALQRLENDAHAADQRLRAALQTFQAEIAGLHDFAAAARATVTEHARTLLGRLLTVSTAEAQPGAQDALEALHARRDAHRQSLHELLSNVSGELMQKVDDAHEPLEQAVAVPLGRVQATLRTDLERVGALAGSQEKDLASHGQTLEAALAELETETTAVPKGLEQIDEAARAAGI